MKVLFIANVPSPYRVEFFNKLSEYCDLTVIYERSAASDRHSNWKAKSNNKYKEIILNSINISNDSSISLGAIKHIKNNNYDIIVSGVYHTITSMLTILYMYSKGINFVLNTDGGFIKSDSKIKYMLKKFFISKATWYLSPSDMSDKYLMYYGAKEKTIYRYPFTSISKEEIMKETLSEYEKEQLKKELEIKEENIIITVGQIIPRKGIDVLLNAMKNIKQDIGVYIIGGDITKEYKEIIEKYELKNIYFEGFKTKEELEKYYKIADIFILPTREDIWGLVINEAMAKGLPIITTDRCNAGIELIENGINGFIVKTNNPNEIKVKIEEIIEDENLKNNIQKNNLYKINKYTIEEMASVHYKIFKNIVNNN